jgi:glycosyltransferase involved in cell wall biosynthesis
MAITQPPPRPARRRIPKIELPQTGRKLSFIVPAPDYNATPEELYNAIRTETETLNADWELLFIDRGRFEKTWLLIHSLVHCDPTHVRAYLFSESPNLSSALALGYREASGDLVFSLEADQQDDPRELSRFLERIEWNSEATTEARDSRHPWQNILPRGVLRGSPLNSRRTAGLAA